MIKIASNGQWTLAKSEESTGPAPTTLHGLIGKTHTVEVHPDIDTLYRLKNHIQKQPKQQMQLADIKRSEFGSFTKKIPRTAFGKVTPELIDKHIASLPKHKVEVKVVPYELSAQKHRAGVPQYVVSVGLHPDTLKNMSSKEQEVWNDTLNASQYMNNHPVWGHKHQVGWARIDPYRVDTRAPLSDKEINANPASLFAPATTIAPNKNHWHIDEIQSQFGSPTKIRDTINDINAPETVHSEIMGDIHRAANPQANEQDRDEIKQKIKDKYPTLAAHVDENLNHRINQEKDRQIINHQITKARIDAAAAHSDPKEFARLQGELNNLYDAKADIERHWDKKLEPWNIKTVALANNIAKSRREIEPEKIHKLLSHGHDDPMHMIHSAINQLGRQNGIESMSMDTPQHQAHQSYLRPTNADEFKMTVPRQIDDYIDAGKVNDNKAEELWAHHNGPAIDQNKRDTAFNSAHEKLGNEGLKQFARLVSVDNGSWLYNGHEDEWDNEVSSIPEGWKMTPEVQSKLQNMTDDEKDALSRFASHYHDDIVRHLANELGVKPMDADFGAIDPSQLEYKKLPLHQVNTYDKRPKKLGFKTVPKEDVLGKHPDDRYNQVQYAKLHKKLRLIQELLRKV